MNFSLKDSFLRPFKGNKCVEKFLIGGGFYLAVLAIYVANIYTNCVPSQQAAAGMSVKETFLQGMKAGFACSYLTPVGFLLTVISFLLLAIPVGYIAQYVHNYINNEEEILPEWKNNFFNFFKKGLAIYLITFLYFILMIIVIIITVVIFVIISHILGFHSKTLGIIISALIGGIINFIFLAIFTYSLCLYAENFKLSQGFNLFKAINYILKSFDKFFICLIVGVVFYLIYIIIDIILRLTIIGAPITSFTILPFWLCLVTPFANAYMVAKEKA